MMAAAIASLALTVSADSAPNENFVPIPANPESAFTRSLAPHSREPGEAAPLRQDYWLAKYPFTNAEYREFCSATGHKTPRYWKNGTIPSGKEKHPVWNVSYADALAYCEWCGKKYPGRKFRQLSESGGFTSPVDNYPQGVSAYGVWDMAGNSRDWTSSEITASNGAERGQKCHAIRGGAWYATLGSCKNELSRGGPPRFRRVHDGRLPAGGGKTRKTGFWNKIEP